jgi:hypothetical protein
METNEFDRSVEAWAAQPHFDDELTVLSAQPVVPLEKIAKVNHRRHWLLGGAFVLAMLLGAGSALLASYLRLRSVPAATAQEVSQEEATAAPMAVAKSVPSESPVVESVAEAPVETPVEPKGEPERPSAVRPRSVARTSPDTDVSPNTSKVDENADLDRLHAVLYEQWQERRARRVARRERRGLDRYNHRDLSNVDEIFEGPRKP